MCSLSLTHSQSGTRCCKLGVFQRELQPLLHSSALAVMEEPQPHNILEGTFKDEIFLFEDFFLYFIFHLMATAVQTAKSKVLLVCSAFWLETLTVFQLCWAPVLGLFSSEYLHGRSLSFPHLCNELHLYKQPTAPSEVSVSAQWWLPRGWRSADRSRSPETISVFFPNDTYQRSFHHILPWCDRQNLSNWRLLAL